MSQNFSEPEGPERISGSLPSGYREEKDPREVK
jgi:hypothetical protein